MPGETSNLQFMVLVGVVGVLCLSVAVSGGVGAEENTVSIESVSPSFVPADEDTVTVIYTADGPDIDDEDVTIRFTDVAGNEFTTDGQSGIDVQETVALPVPAESGPYDVTIETGVESDSLDEAFEVAPVYDPDDGDIEMTTHTTAAGDQVYINVSLNDVEEGFLVVGGDRPADQHEVTNYLDVLHVEESTTFRINTRLLGTDTGGGTDTVYFDPNDHVTSYAYDYGAETAAENTDEFANLRFETESYEQVGESLAEFRDEVGITHLPRPIQPGTYSLTLASGNSLMIREDGIPDPRQPLDRAALELTQPSLDDMTVYRHPTGNANEVFFDTNPLLRPPLRANNTDLQLANAQETDTIAVDDKLIVEIEATGIYGALLSSDATPFPLLSTVDPGGFTPAEFAPILETHEGISLEITERNPGPNQTPATFDILDADRTDVFLVPGRTNEPDFPDLEPGEIGEDEFDDLFDDFLGEHVADHFYLVIDTRGETLLGEELTGGEEFEIAFAYESIEDESYRFQTPTGTDKPQPFDPRNTPTDGTEQYPYFDIDETTVRESATLEVEEKAVAYNRTTADGRPILETNEETLSGTTNIAPGAGQDIDIIFDVRQEPTRVVAEGVDIEPDGSFEVTEDLSAIDPDDDVEITFRAYQDVIDERDAFLIEPDGDASAFVIDELETISETTSDATTVDVGTTIRNAGAIADNATIELFIEDEPVDSAEVELSPDGTAEITFDVPDEDYGPGNYVVEVRTPHDEQIQLLVVREPVVEFEIDSVAVDSPVTEGGPLDVDATLRNNGTVRGETEVTVRVGDTELGTETVSAFDGETISPSFEGVTASLDPGEYQVTLETPDDEKTVRLTVEPEAGEVLVSSLSVESPVAADTQVHATTTITNTADSERTGPVTIALDGEQRFEKQVTLDGSATETLDLGDAIGELSPGEYTLRVETEDDEERVEFVVEDDEGGDGDGSTPGLFGVGVGTRELAAGTATVGVIHVLGHWV